MSLRAHGSSTVVSCFACASGSCCSAAVGSGWLSLSPLVFAFLDSGAPRFHFLPVVPPGGRFAPCRAHTDSSSRQHTMQARRAGGTHLSTLIARGLSTTVVRPHGQRARAAQDLVGCGLRSDRSGNIVKQARDEFLFGLATLALVRETGLQLARSVLNDALGKALATLLLGWPFGDAIALTSELARGIAKIDTCTSGSGFPVDTCTSGSGFSVDTCTSGSGFSVDTCLR